MKIQEGQLDRCQSMLLDNCISGDVIHVSGSTGNPYLVVDPQNYHLYVYRKESDTFQTTTGEGVVVVSLRDSRLRKLNGRTDVDVIKAEVFTE